MPGPRLCRTTGGSSSESGRNSTWKPEMRLAIVRHSFLVLQAIQEAKQLVPRPIATESALQWCRLRERLLFHGQRGLEIDLRGVHRFMPEPEGDHGPVHPRLEELHGRAASQA